MVIPGKDGLSIRDVVYLKRSVIPTAIAAVSSKSKVDESPCIASQAKLPLKDWSIVFPPKSLSRPSNPLPLTTPG
jgi:hypothetical protein